MDHVDFKTAAAKLAGVAGLTDDRPQKQASAVRPTPARIVRAGCASEGFLPVAEYYFGDDLRKVRFEHKTKTQPGKDRPEKDFRWEHRSTSGEWLSGAGGKPKGLYLNGIMRDRTRPGASLGLEGEAKVDTAGTLGIAAFSFREISTRESAKSLAGMDVVLWPDNDEPGRQKLSKSVELIAPYARSIHVVEPPDGLPEGGDIVDAVQTLGWDAAAVQAHLKTGKKTKPESASSQEGGESPEQKRDDLAGILYVDQVRPLRYFASQQIEYVLHGMWAVGTVNLISGESGSGKTTLVTAICDAIRQGKQFAGLATTKRQILMLDRENPLSLVVERFDRLGIEDSFDFRIWGGWELEEPAGAESAVLIDWVRSCEPKPVLVFDSFIANLEGDENSSRDVRKCFQGFRNLANLGATIIVICHSGKGESSQNYRGSSDVQAAVDVAYRITNLGDPSRLGMVQAKAFKQRFAVQPEIVFSYHDGAFRRDGRTPSQSNADALRDLLIQNPGIKRAEFEKLATEKGISRVRFRSFVDAEILTGSIRVETGEKNAKSLTWTGRGNAKNEGF